MLSGEAIEDFCWCYYLVMLDVCFNINNHIEIVL